MFVVDDILVIFAENLKIMKNKIKNYLIKKQIDSILIKCQAKDKIINILLHEFDNMNGLNEQSKKIQLCDIQTNEYFNGKTDKIISPYHLFNYFTYNNFVSLLDELNNDGFIMIEIINNNDLAYDTEKNIRTNRYYCKYVTKLGKMKMSNGGFVKEYNDIQDRKREKHAIRNFNIVTLIVISIYTFFTILSYYKK